MYWSRSARGIYQASNFKLLSTSVICRPWVHRNVKRIRQIVVLMLVFVQAEEGRHAHKYAKSKGWLALVDGRKEWTRARYFSIRPSFTVATHHAHLQGISPFVFRLHLLREVRGYKEGRASTGEVSHRQVPPPLVGARTHNICTCNVRPFTPKHRYRRVRLQCWHAGSFSFDTDTQTRCNEGMLACFQSDQLVWLISTYMQTSHNTAAHACFDTQIRIYCVSGI